MSTVNVALGFGHSRIMAQIPAANLRGVLVPEDDFKEPDEAVLVHEALAHPVASPRLRDLARPDQKIVIVTSDRTRPCPSQRLIPYLLDELSATQVPDANITLVIALGLHRPMSASEQEAAVGPDVYRRVRVINHDPEDIVRLGATAAGTPAEIFRPVVEADLRICLGNLELHYFAGYSGGAKAILPGCASRATVNANHSLLTWPGARAGCLEGNPVRADMEEAVAMLGVDFILNVVVDGQHRVVGAVAGQVIAAHRRGCELAKRRSTVSIPKHMDIVLASAGGYPKDIDLYQAQKALDNAAYAVRPGGIIILVAECYEGLGNPIFESWMCQARSPDDLICRIQQQFVVGGHKAAAIAVVLKRARVFLVSGLPDKLAGCCGFVPFQGVDDAIQAALDEMGPGADIIMLPQGGSVLPLVD